MTKKELKYLQRLEDRCNILRARKGQEALKELHALEWALTYIWASRDDEIERRGLMGDS